MFVLGWFAFLNWILGEDERPRSYGIKSGPPPKLPPRAPSSATPTTAKGNYPKRDSDAR